MKKLIETDLATGITEEIEYNKSEKRVTVKHSQDVEPFINANKADLNADSGNFKGDMHKVASIPPIVIEDWANELRRMGRNPWPFHKSNKTWLIARLNSRDWRALRTKRGNI